ncbi:MAG: hypothetical protein GY758_30355 [Fuerstiella sp.]|nr:hypothetical protein [Fuerstiella sp.]MCP4511366.1 hypothetical protein [Fuerstiella sp.]
MLKSIVAPLKFGFVNSLKQPRRRRLQSEAVGFCDSLEVRLLLTGPQLVNPIASDAYILTDVASDHGGDLTVNVDVDGDGNKEFSMQAAEGDPLLIDLTAYIAPNTIQNVTLQIVESPDPFSGGTEMSNSVTLNVAGLAVLATEFDWVQGANSQLSGAVDMTSSIGTIDVLYRVAGENEWNEVGEVTASDGSFLFEFGLADGETDFDFAVRHSFMGATVISSAETIFDMTAYLTGSQGPTSDIDDLFEEGYG